MAHTREDLWGSGYDESVEVNQRALIDKVLARYSGEFTVFRELLQNSDDASSKTVEIHFETEAYAKRPDQSAQDALDSASSISEKLPDLKTAVVHQWTFKNDGVVFRDEDWARLKKIAEGNPDEEKIGAFGVGFYSLFSVTEEPFVTSGDQWMGFYWKGGKDQLFARRGKLPEAERSEWTAFTMPLREPVPLLTPFDFIRFLASSITFMARLSEVSVFFDGKRLANLKKDRGIPRPLALRKGLKPATAKGTMKVASVSVTPLHIKGEVMQWVYAAGSSAKPRKRMTVEQQQTRKAVTSGFFSSLLSTFGATPQRGATPLQAPPELDNTTENEDEEQKKLLQVNETSVTLSVFSAEVNVHLDERIKKELLRATKKNPPTTMKYELIYTGKDEYDASKKEDERSPQGTGSVFQGLRADIDGAGSARVFIGHSTAQTTGIGGHMSARFIPTVERESIDFMDRNVRVWNEELIGVGGYLARTAYEEEMYTVASLWPKDEPEGSNNDASARYRKSLSDRALHALKFFSFHASTPSSQVSTLLEEAFFSCVSSSPFSFITGEATSHPFPIISTIGIRGAAEVRLPNPTFTEFLKQLPVVSSEVMQGAKIMVDALQARDMIKEVTFADVLKELRARPLPESEMVACFKWWIDLHKSGAVKQIEQARGELLNAAIMMTGTLGSNDEKIIPLASIQTFTNHRGVGALIPLDGPLPPHLLPPSVSRHFDPQLLRAAFNWQELLLPGWLQHILDPQVRAADVEHDLTLSPVWAERVLTVLTRAWQTSPKTMQQTIIDLLKDISCVPTINGMKVPRDAYFQNAHVFPDLPLVKLPSGSAIKGPMEKILEALGVRKHVDLQIVFNRMIKTGDWSIVDLIKYLVAVQSTLSDDETTRLKMTAAFSAESTPSDGMKKPERFRADQLYEPLDTFRKLGLPILDWGTQTKWKPSSEEAKFLYKLGLRRFPPLDTILTLAAEANEDKRSQALKFFLDNHGTKYSSYKSTDFSTLAFIPALRNNKPCLAKPSEVFAKREWSIMGFLVASPTLSAEDMMKLGIRDYPPSKMLVDFICSTPPEDEEVAKQWFSLMAGHVTDYTNSQLQTLSQSPIVPVKSSGSGSLRLVPPKQCYFRTSSETQQLHSRLFTFVDFGHSANQFLSACGTKREPTVEEVVQILLENPRRFYETAEGRDNYLTELRNIAVNRRLLSSGTTTRMKRSAILLGSRRIRHEKKDKTYTEFDEEDDWEYEYSLLTPDKVIIADDTNSFQLFGEAVFSCPQEDLLEDFYFELGSRRLSTLVKDEYKMSSEVKHTRKAAEVRTLILERLPLFLHEHTHTQTRVPFSWLNQDQNFVVRAFGKLTVVKSLLYDQKRVVKNQDASAIAFRDGRGPIQLWLAGNDQVDMYEVSTSLCRLLFEHPRASDALLFMTILSTDLRALRRRGYNGAFVLDRILQRQKSQRRAAEDAAREHAKQTALVQPSPEEPAAPPFPVPQLPPPSDEKSSSASASDDTLIPQPTTHDNARSIRNSMLTWKQKFTGKPPTPRSSLDAPPMPGDFSTGAPLLPPPQPIADVGNALLPPPRPSPSRPMTPNAGITPTHNIATNIDAAIRACREEKGELFKSNIARDMKVVKESLNDGYCDTSGQAIDLVLAGEMGGIKVFMSRDVPQPKEVLARKRESLARFVHIIHPLAKVYGLPTSSLHIFYDLTGGTIAFNRSASIFLNLRFFEAWHDAKVDRREMTEAYVSWYFSLAHEIAHNLVQPHNAEHEFWFSSICEKYMPAFVALLTSIQ
ncbi:hypothetical protein PHLGIDRAFT_102310 [Phlebiopsis gigantea 11061_1 CR5-6]|uniref:Sacsin/Nov domain-containing protein n=1 Tax=Phlebiopsis gigantea (strain 11061_1 CR5-6) TaxID=745531 RepID=A0A0C3SB54_PHLG1|nr:hypothetical protein PHLGIDRAFT_102310 [Phlebiopsis gigantea 11061_1 CR5-6]